MQVFPSKARTSNCLWHLLATSLVCLAACSPSVKTGAKPSEKPGGKSVDKIKPPIATYIKRDFEMPRTENPGYVGYQQCAECHQERVAECESTSHFQTCRVPNLERMPAAFTSQDLEDRILRLPDTDVRFEMSYRDGKFFQTAFREGSDQRVESSIDLVYGAKTKSDEVYLSWHDDHSMWELPAAWIFAQDCWGAAGFNRLQGTDFARELTVRCFECHTTWFEHIPGTLGSYYREELLLGVTCERCHGPGKEHVEFHRKNPAVTESHAILYPGGLPRERLIEVCTQCHSNAIRHRGPALSFRPGDKLQDYYRFVHPKYGEDDHVADQIDDLSQSACFQQSEMTCITCHDPHLTDKAPHGQTFQETCTQCHEPVACKQRSLVPIEVADNCVECHMRKYAKINVNFDLADDSYVPPLQRSQHRIAVDEVATQEVLYRWYITLDDGDSQEKAAELKQQLLSHWFSEGEQLSASGRFTAAVAAMREILRLDGGSQAAREQLDQYAAQQRSFDDLLARAQLAMSGQRYSEAIDLFQQVLVIRPDETTAVGRLGTIYAQQGDRELAETTLKQVEQLDPDDQYGLSMLAWLALLEGDYSKAAGLYEQANAIEPYNSKLNQLWGTALVRANRVDEGIERLKVALQSDPRNIEAMRDLVDANLQKGDVADALQWAEQAARLTEHQSLRELMVLAECHLAAQNQAMAADVVRIALSVAANDQAARAEITKWASQNGLEL